MNVNKAISLLLANGMQMVLDQYVPDHEDRQKALVLPLYASLDKNPRLVHTMIITGEADISCDEAKAYAHV